VRLAELSSVNAAEIVVFGSLDSNEFLLFKSRRAILQTKQQANFLSVIVIQSNPMRLLLTLKKLLLKLP
jgi:hypothetical protein